MTVTSVRFLPRPAVLFAGLGVAAAVVLFLFDPNHSRFYPGCVFYRTTGLLCPGCGCLRAAHQLLHGHFALAFRFNPLLILTLMGFAVWWAATLTKRTKKRGLSGVVDNTTCAPNRPLPGEPTGVSVWIWCYLMVVVVFWILRNLPGPTFGFLRP